MTCDLEAVTPTGPVFRVGHTPDPWAWPDWSHARPDGTFDNRWDDPEASFRVLYASTTRFGALLETLSPFRPDLGIVAALSEIDGDDDPVAAGTVPGGWFERRLMGIAEVDRILADVGAASSLASLRSHLANRGVHYGLAHVDAAAIRLKAPRRFTQQVSRFVHECRTEEGSHFAGIHYGSRLDDQTYNWASFEPVSDSPPSLHSFSFETIRPDDPGAARAVALLGLRIA